MPRATDLPTLVIVITTAIALMALAWALARAVRRRREFGSPVDRATYDTLHTASLASHHLRDGLTPQGASRAAKHLRAMLGTQAIALCDNTSTLAWDGAGAHHREHVWRHASEVLASGRTVVLDARDVACGDPDCPIRTAVLAPVISDERVVAALAAYGPNASAGLARATEDDAHVTQSGAIIGTPAYMAPEQARSEEVDYRCDLFSLGCVLYRLCTGVMPFKGKDTISTLMAVTTEMPKTPHESNGDVPLTVSELVMKLLAKDKAERPA